VNPEPFLQLDRVIHEKGRLAIMSMLAATHVRTLQEAGYVAVAKSFQNNRPLTTCSMTAAGRKAFAGYVELLEQIVQQTKPR
jgi:predicted ArsR family transcriptional regulator